MAKRILLVDDERDLVETVTFRLKALGYEVITAYDGKEALDKARGEKPDLIILDINMPGIDGVQIAKRVRRDPHLRNIPLIAMTGSSRGKEALKAGCCALLKKPFSHAPFRTVIEKTLTTNAES